MSFRSGVRWLIAGGLVVLCMSLAAAQGTRVEDWVSVTVDGRPIADRGAVISGKTYLPLNKIAQELNLHADYDAATKTVKVTTDNAAPAQINELKAQLASTTAELNTAKSQVATLKTENEKLCRLVGTASFFGYGVRCIGRSIDYNDARPREQNQYRGVVTFCGYDLFILPPSRGGGNDASGLTRAKEISQTLNDLFSDNNRELRPESFAQTTTGTTGARYAITYRSPSGGEKPVCDVDPRYAQTVFTWIKGQERALGLPPDRRLRSPQQAEELLRDWWLAELRDLVSLVRETDYVGATTTKTKDAEEIFKTVLRPRLQLQYPRPEGAVSYQPLAVMNVLGSLTPEEKLKSFDMFDEGGLLAYFTTVWKPSN